MNSGGLLDAMTVDTLYNRYVDIGRFGEAASLTAFQILQEIAGLLHWISDALDGSARYHGEISALSQKGPPSADRS